MKKEKWIFSSLLFMATAFGLTACGDDDKSDEIVPDPLETKVEYFIVGTVTDANGAVKGATVDAGGDIKTTTGNQGEYSLTVSEAKTYTVKFSAGGLENYESKATIASGAPNRSQVTLSVKMAKAIDYSKGKTETASKEEDVDIEAPAGDGSATPEAVVNVPAAAAPENTEITVVSYEEPATADNSTSAQTTENTASMSNIAIKTNPAGAKAEKDIVIKVPNAAASESEGYFDPEYMVALKEAITTRAAEEFGKVKMENNNFIAVIAKGSAIDGKYAFKLKYKMKAGNVTAGDYNKVNGKAEVLRLENRDYDALKDVKLTVDVTNGWEYATTPEAALKAANASEALAGEIRKAITANEGREGTYTTTLNLTTDISGNHVLFFGSKAKVQNKTYTFKVINKGGKNNEINVTLKKYAGYTEEYTNGPISQHSGGTTGK